MRKSTHIADELDDKLVGVRADLRTILRRADEAMDCLNRALHFAQSMEERWYEAEIYRLRAAAGDMVGTDPSARVADLSRAIEIARAQGAVIWERRALRDVEALRRSRQDA